MTRGTHGISKVISIVFAGFIGFLTVYYFMNYLNYSDLSESIIKPVYLSFLIATGLLILISNKKNIMEYRFFKNTINKQ
jgi:ABC-type Mn2+/Zn2+ transport system permease subunit